MKCDNWMPWYIADYLASTMHLTTLQHGAYMLLLGAYWRNQGPLEDDSDQLSAICRLSKKEWEKTRPVVAKFFVVSEGVWRQKRCDAELTKSKAIAAKRSEVGRNSVNHRWNRSRTVSQNDTPRIPDVSQNDTPRIPDVSQNDTQTHTPTIPNGYSSPSPTLTCTHTHTTRRVDLPEDPKLDSPPAALLEADKNSENPAWAEAPSLNECLTWAATIGAELASGAPAIDPEWVQDWWGYRQNQVGWDIASWRGTAREAWRKQWRKWPQIKARRQPVPEAQRDAIPRPPKVESPWERKQRVEALQAAVDGHAANRLSSSYVGESGVTPAMESDLKEKRAKLSEARKGMEGAK
jgi:uncharacterized protein YdaU (DUF1376 family)